jgi:3'-phosphoadenosine 5'-phosphosulfate (PAPS) 3'-phosphatase
MKTSRLVKTFIKSALNSTVFIKEISKNKDKIFKLSKAKEQIFTNVDIGSQYIIRETIRREIKAQIEVIEEEDLEHPKAGEIISKDKLVYEGFMKGNEDYSKLANEAITEIMKNSKDEMVDLSKCKLMLDPLDATVSFLGEEYSDVTTLIGLLKNNKPFIGVIGAPFATENGVHLYFNIPREGVFKLSTDNKKDELKIIKMKEKTQNYKKPINILTSFKNVNKLQEICNLLLIFSWKREVCK